MHKKHFFLSNNIAEARGFSPQKQGFDGHTLPSKDRVAQASMVKEQYVAVVNQIVTHLEERVCDKCKIKIHVQRLHAKHL